MPRNTRLTPEVASGILASLRDGGNVKDACASVGISRATYYKWLGRGEHGPGVYSEFHKAAFAATAAGDVKRHHDLLVSLGAIAA